MIFEKKVDHKKIAGLLNRILELELAGVVRYTHYSFMVYGYNRMPIVTWLRAQASEGLLHANEAGEFLTSLGEHPTMGIGPLVETRKHEISDILRESMEHESRAIAAYRALLAQVEGKSVLLEEYARRMVAQEVMHLGEVEKMLRQPPEARPGRRRG